MKPKVEKRIMVVLVIVTSICLVLQYVVGVDSFSDPVMAKYWIEIVLYPSVLAVLILVWRQTLDKKIEGKEQRKKRHEDLKREH
ncbi:hypothetical protein EV198_3052 [Roseivirga ehrenbergii]|uniref:Uncharacterized protein n=1 Tax=Roseivirga ehrenbergii (strain DSM 102268 / JCM 13514 / KCTC 12282 / NCIMB 14502 / KMM 6017) TaxID=279360 RepID=A0A150XLH4_ROSEK|nr:hypothetical protein [Roseivirga ehrenbergii]KYG79561.1 hypothetical protein MB14_17010 [Roseivirga ehrenbergii]TCL01034.1 hypothetical protein EV198_3052 [Roseivirga ehrenbergii]